MKKILITAVLLAGPALAQDDYLYTPSEYLDTNTAIQAERNALIREQTEIMQAQETDRQWQAIDDAAAQRRANTEAAMEKLGPKPLNADGYYDLN